ncbi:MAG TPA: potassium transporter TrkG [Phycisphaerae bacterium]|nr:potassium transporter TrkG [Phycisphaerae bacterium]HRR86393.1 potassium transporter TrkG [Phycisphaerae bacterium]
MTGHPAAENRTARELHLATQEYLPLFPKRTRWLWWPSALAGVVGLALTYGFDEPAVDDRRIHQILLAAAILFLLSRIMLLIPPVEISARIGRCWLDFAVLLAGAVWWGLDHDRQREVIEIIAGYSAAIGFLAASQAGVKWLIEGPLPGVHPGPVRRLFLAGLFLAIVGGLILSLPRCWARGYPASSESGYTGQFRYEVGAHALNCLFTSASAITGTGLSVHDIGHDFSLGGQIVILLLMQIGGLAILAIGTVLGLRLRAMLGWETHQDDTTPEGLRRAVRFSCLLLLTIEVIGLLAMFFAQPRLFDSSEPLRPKIVASVFHTISAACNVGLTLNSDSMVGARGLATTYAVILPLMILGGIGGPFFFSIYRKLRDRTARMPVDVWLTLVATVLLVVIGAGLLYGIESTYTWQLRYPQEKTLGSLQWNGASSAPAGEIVFGSGSSERVQAERMSTMRRGPRIAAAFFQSVTARTCGMRTARLDDKSLSPASRYLLMVWMLIGGSVGGTAGGVRICVVGLLLLAIVRPRGRLWRSEASLSHGTGRQTLAAAGVVVAAMALVIVVTSFVLIYRQRDASSGSYVYESSSALFESISACTNTGLSAGLTAQLPTEDHLSGPVWLRVTSRSVLILAMLLGRVLPVGILLRWAAIKGRQPPP